MTESNIKVVPADFDQAYTELMALSDSLAKYKATLASSYAAMGSDWRGAASGAFTEKATGLFDDYDFLTGKMKNIANDIKKAGAAFQSQDDALGKAISIGGGGGAR